MSHILLGALTSRESRLREKEPLFIDTNLNRQHVHIMVDIGATHYLVGLILKILMTLCLVVKLVSKC